MHKPTRLKHGYVADSALWFREWYPTTLAHLEMKCMHVFEKGDLLKAILERESPVPAHQMALEHFLSNQQDND